MAAFTPSRLGQADNSGDTDALFLKVFPGEVLAAFREENRMMERTIVRTIASGKSATFPAIGRAGASYMTPGAELTGNTIRVNERVISIDSLLVADTFVANIDEAMNHFDIRGEFATQLGGALARTADNYILRVGCLGARASATLGGTNDPGAGHSAANTNSDTDASELADSLSTAARRFDEEDVPKSDRYVALKPAQFHLAAQYTNFLNRDWGGEGSIARAQVPYISGFEVVETNNMPTTNISTNPTGANNTYNGDFSKTVCLCFHRSAIGTASLLGLAVERDYSVRHQGTLMVAKYAMGHDYLRPEALFEVLNNTL